MPLTNVEVDAAVPTAGTPNRALTNAALKELITDVAAKQDADAGLGALAALTGTGMLAQTADNVYAVRTISVDALNLTVNNGTGQSGDPTIGVVQATQVQAEAGISANGVMTPLRTKQAIDAQVIANFGTGANDFVQLDGSARLPAVDGSQLTNLPSGSTLPVDDTTSLARDPADNTKQVRFDVGGLPTATTAVLTIDESIDFTEILSGTSGQRLGFDATPEAAVFDDIRSINVNMDGETTGGTAVAEFVLNYSGTIDACTGKTDAGTIDLAIAINGTGVTGLGTVSLDTTLSGNRDTASGANTFAAGDIITITKSNAASSPTRVLAVVEVTPTSLPAALS